MNQALPSLHEGSLEIVRYAVPLILTIYVLEFYWKNFSVPWHGVYIVQWSHDFTGIYFVVKKIMISQAPSIFNETIANLRLELKTQRAISTLRENHNWLNETKMYLIVNDGWGFIICFISKQNNWCLCHQILFYNLNIFATQCCRPLTFQTLNSVGSNIQSLKYQRFIPSSIRLWIYRDLTI